MSLPNVKKFVSATEIEEERQKRQEEWEKVRKPDQPLEAPEEEPVDRRCLYERLQEQKDKKQADIDEQHKMKNQVRGLDSDEADFLEFVNQRQQELESERLKEEEETLALLREPVTKPTPSKPTSSDQSARQPFTCQGPKKMTQAEILGRVVKRKRNDSNEASEAKKVKGNNSSDEGDSSHESPKAKAEVSGACKDLKPLKDASPERVNVVPREAAVARVIGILPGIGVYSNSSESDTSSSDSEIDTDLLRRSVAKEVEKMIQAAAHQH